MSMQESCSSMTEGQRRQTENSTNITNNAKMMLETEEFNCLDQLAQKYLQTMRVPLNESSVLSELADMCSVLDITHPTEAEMINAIAGMELDEMTLRRDIARLESELNATNKAAEQMNALHTTLSEVVIPPDAEIETMAAQAGEALDAVKSYADVSWKQVEKLSEQLKEAGFVPGLKHESVVGLSKEQEDLRTKLASFQRQLGVYGALPANLDAASSVIGRSFTELEQLRAEVQDMMFDDALGM
ncbi:hypothetical protein J8273_1366 [Carpediemonas membranifera]|uniref:Uncharacterized protein n=1 Tax=Carpediemonas membranifera TaxID=201153 RepID=A0A8J6EBE9_9EUKA|nr:hypothetical protein J8273_1366 [Carpediemonas membranifera]|eukprot:KAG9397015.1 hypothetical protein J8273_1366 [Carpediemonas membranifera]